MGTRIFICADVKFPREDPGANRIQFVAKALMAEGHDVTIISCGRTDGKISDDGYYYYDGIRYFNISGSGNKIVKAFKQKVFCGKSVLSVLKKYAPVDGDIVYIYSSNSLFISPISKWAKKKGLRTFIEVVEWHQPYEYKYGSVDPRCVSTKHAFESLAPRIGNILAISEIIADYYKKRNCHVDVFPVFVDTYAQNVDDQEVDVERIHLVYPGNPINKDNVATMIRAMLSLEKHELEKLVFHMTGSDKKRIQGILGQDAYLVDEIGDHIVFHGWMEYDELVELYKKMDFLYMCRFNNEVSRANFPSKLPELMAWGIAPICNKVGDYYKYLTDDKNAIVFENDTVEDCTSALRRAIVLSPKRRAEMRKNARQCAIDNFDYRSWQKKLTDFMEL